MNKLLSFIYIVLFSSVLYSDPYIPSIRIDNTQDVKQELKKISKVINGSLGAGNVKDRSFSSDKLLETGVTAGSYLNANITVDSKGRITAASGSVTLTFVSVPATSSSTGSVNQFSYDNTYFYICIGVDTWKRIQFSAW